MDTKSTVYQIYSPVSHWCECCPMCLSIKNGGVTTLGVAKYFILWLQRVIAPTFCEAQHWATHVDFVFPSRSCFTISQIIWDFWKMIYIWDICLHKMKQRKNFIAHDGFVFAFSSAFNIYHSFTFGFPCHLIVCYNTLHGCPNKCCCSCNTCIPLIKKCSFWKIQCFYMIFLAHRWRTSGTHTLQ